MENQTHFTSDHHFGHNNIIRYSQRPFASPEAMDEALIERWNRVVGDDDVVYHLGDFTLGSRGTAARALSRLRGRIRVLGYPWHHDAGWLPRQLGPSDYRSASGHAVEILGPMVVLKVERQVIVLCHYPLARWDRRHHGAWHLHGHSHGTYHSDGAILDVGVDCHDFTPVALDQLRAVFA